MNDATILSLVFSGAILIMSVIIHEVSHGIAALALGDKTAKYAGRITLNPIPHIDPVGSILLPFLLILSGSPFLIGWARPVPYNPYNLRDQKWGPGIVGIAGPFSNLAIAALFGILIRAINAGIFPFFTQSTLVAFSQIAAHIVIINIALAIFNLIPIPPLDGSKVLFSLLSYRMYHIQQQLEQWGFMLLLFFIFFLSSIISTITVFLFSLITGIRF